MRVKIYILERNGIPYYVGKTIQSLQERLYTHKENRKNDFILEIDNVDESAIVAGIRKLQTYSDITDLNKALMNARMGSLESFLNKQLSDDISEKYRIVNYLNDAAKRSNKGPIAKLGTNGDIAIMI
jgi:predicted GIY-YIG superfamily endonuclease